MNIYAKFPHSTAALPANTSPPFSSSGSSSSSSSSSGSSYGSSCGCGADDMTGHHLASSYR
eukprot:gene8247-835_t